MDYGEDVSDEFSTGAPFWPSVPPSEEEFMAPVLGSITQQTPGEAEAELRTLEAEAREKIRLKYGDRYADSAKIEYSKLDRADRIRILTRIEQIRGFRSTEYGAGVLDRGFGPELVKGFEQARMMGDRPWGRIPVDVMAKLSRGEQITAQDVFFATIPVQHEARELRRDLRGRPTEAAADLYYVSGRQHTQDTLQSIADSINEGDLAPERFSVLDIESPSLDPEEGVWSLAIRRFEHGKAAGEAKEWKFPNPAMKMGVAGPDSRLLADIQALPGEDAPVTEWLTEALREMEAGDWNLVGHNISFDYAHLIPFLKKQPAYAAGGEYTELVDRFQHVFTKEQRKVWDTNVLSHLLQRDLKVAPELASRAVGTPHSMENILLQTDALERMVDEGMMSAEQVTAALERGTHNAQIDVELEGNVFKFLGQVTQGKRLELRPPRPEWRALVLRSRPLGPRIDLAPQNMAPEILEALRPMPGLEKTFRITPAEQAMILSRQTVLRPTGPAELESRVGLYRQFMGRIFTPEGRIREGGVGAPSVAEFREIQQSMAEAGVPYSRLHYIERQATGVLAKGAFGDVIEGAEDVVDRQRLASQMGDYLGDIWLKEAERPSIFPSGILNIPRRHLEEIFGEGAPEVAGFNVSPFEIPARVAEGIPAKKDIGFMFGFSPGQQGEVQLQRIRAALLDSETLHRWGLEPQVAAQMLAKLQEKGTRTPIQALSMFGGKGGAERMVEGLEPALGEMQDESSDQMSRLMVLNPRKDLRGEAVGGRVRMGPAVLRKDAGEDFIGEVMGQIPAQREEAERLLSMTRGERAALPGFEEEAVRGVTPIVSAVRKSRKDIIDAVDKNYLKFGKYAKGGVAAGAIALGGYYLWKRYSAKQKVNETIAAQPYEPGTENRPTAPQYDTGSYFVPKQVSGAVSNVVPFAGNDTGYRRQQYMQTANVVSNLNRNRTRHHQMDTSTKYNYLYGGGG